MRRADLRALAGYLLLALGMTWPLVLSPGGAYVGFANIDALDTMTLRGLIAQLSPSEAPWTDGVFFPVGYPVLHLTPNVLDHLTGAVLDWVLPVPLSDNLWWLLVLTLNGWCAHRLGRRLGESEAAGWLCGVAFLLSEPVARETNLHHAPQAMVFWGPLYLEAVLALRAAPSARRAALAGLWLAGAGWSYWYFAFFLGLSSLPLLLLARIPLLHLGMLGGTALLVAAPGLAPWLLWFSDLAITAMSPPDPAQPSASYAALPQAQAFITQHGSDPLFWLRRGPVDVSNRVSLSLLVAAGLGAWRSPRWAAAGLGAMALLGAAMVLGPYLRWGDEVVLLGGTQPVSLPFRWLGSLHPFLGRLTWPERWGVVISLGLAGLAARAPRPALLAAVIGIESLLVSANLPVQVTTLRFEKCWAELSHATGAILELPQRRPGLRAARVGVHRRFHRRPVINPLLLPPGVETPEEWKEWKEAQPLLQFVRTFESGKWPDDPGAESIRAMQQAGVSALVLDTEPGVMLTEGQLNRY